MIKDPACTWSGVALGGVCCGNAVVDWNAMRGGHSMWTVWKLRVNGVSLMQKLQVIEQESQILSPS